MKAKLYIPEYAMGIIKLSILKFLNLHMYLL